MASQKPLSPQGETPSWLARPLVWSIAALAAFLLAAKNYLWFCHNTSIGTLDYPLQIVSTARVLRGELPYRDFQTLYGPLGYYISAFFLWPFRHHSLIFPFNTYVVACFALCYVFICFGFSRIRAARPVLLIGGMYLIVRSGKVLSGIIYYSLPMLMPVVLATVVIPYTIETPARSRRRATFWQAVCGTLIAAEIFIRINFGFYVAVAIAITGLAAFLAGKKAVARAALRCLIAATIAFLVLLAVFAAAGIAKPFIADMWAFIPRAAPARRMPWKYDGFKELAVMCAVFVAVSLLRCIPRIRRADIGFWLMPYVLLCGFFHYTFLRFDSVHALPFFIVALLLLGDTSIEPHPQSASPVIAWLRRCYGLAELQLVVFFLVLHALSPFSHLLGLQRKYLAFTLPTAKVTSESLVSKPEPITTLRHVIVLQQEADMLHHLDTLRHPGDEVFWMSAPGSCQSTFDMCTNLSLYLADGTLPRQYIWYFDTPTTPYEDIQQRIVAGLEANKTPWIGVQDVFVRNMIGIGKPEATILGDYVLSHYTVVFTTDIPSQNRRYSICARKPQG